jgi:hypothetical protein
VGELGEAIFPPLRESPFDDDVLALDPAVLAQALPEYLVVTARGTGGYKTDPMDLSWLLCLEGHLPAPGQQHEASRGESHPREALDELTAALLAIAAVDHHAPLTAYAIPPHG